MKVRIKDVAQAAGVSVTTVSRVLGNRGVVSREARARVLSALETTGYTRSTLMHKTAKRFVAVCPPADPEHWQLNVCRAVTTELQASGVLTLSPLLSMDTNQPTSLTQVNAAVAAGAGAVVTPMFTPLDLPVPVVRFAESTLTGPGSAHAAEVIAARLDLAGGLDLAFEHLADLGHRRIGLVCNDSGDLAEILIDRFISHHPARTLGSYLRDWIAPVPKSLSGGVRAAAQLRDATCTAVIVQSNMQTYGVLEALKRRRLVVPRDLSVVAFGDCAAMRFTGPPVTVLSFDGAAMAEALAAGTRHVLGLPGVPMQSVPPHFRPRLIARSSTAGVRS